MNLNQRRMFRTAKLSLYNQTSDLTSQTNYETASEEVALPPPPSMSNNVPDIDCNPK